VAGGTLPCHAEPDGHVRFHEFGCGFAARRFSVSMDPWLSLSVISAPYLDCAPSPLDGSGLPSTTNR